MTGGAEASVEQEDRKIAKEVATTKNAVRFIRLSFFKPLTTKIRDRRAG